LVRKWCSQPVLNNRLHAGDLLTSAAILFSGNNYTKVALFAKFMHLPFVCKSTFFKLQRLYLVPVIDAYWQEVQAKVLEELADKPIVVLGKQWHW